MVPTRPSRAIDLALPPARARDKIHVIVKLMAKVSGVLIFTIVFTMIFAGWVGSFSGYRATCADGTSFSMPNASKNSVMAKTKGRDCKIEPMRK